MKSVNEALIMQINKFISGEDISITAANVIEVWIDDAYPDDEMMQDVVLLLASYRPGGGEYLYNEKTIKNKLEKVLANIQKENLGGGLTFDISP